ncbi:hypothetical protein V5799_022995 [Amblyomma americanum]|uniref:Uncharacterized protein n=1 Tax=Amblyomma americanum TaxID=6943 RepID=A0AAQ4FJ12_AMBAM
MCSVLRNNIWAKPVLSLKKHLKTQVQNSSNTAAVWRLGALLFPPLVEPPASDQSGLPELPPGNASKRKYNGGVSHLISTKSCGRLQGEEVYSRWSTTTVT